MEQYLRVGCYENIDWKKVTETDLAYWESNGYPPTREEIVERNKESKIKTLESLTLMAVLLGFMGYCTYSIATEKPKEETPAERTIKQYDLHPRDNRLNSNELEHLLRDIELKKR